MFSLNKPVVLNRGVGVKEFTRGGEPLHALQHGKFLNGNVSLPNVTQVLILRCYKLFGLVPAKTEFEPADKYSGVQLGGCLFGIPSPFNNDICAVLAFESAMVHIEFQGSRLHGRAARLIPDRHECIHFA